MACTHITEIMGEHAHIIRDGDSGLPTLYFPTACKAVREVSMQGEGSRGLELEDRRRR